MLPYSHRCFGGAIRELGGVLWFEPEPAAPYIAAQRAVSTTLGALHHASHAPSRGTRVIADAAHPRARAGTLTMQYLPRVISSTWASINARYTCRSAAK